MDIQIKASVNTVKELDTLVCEVQKIEEEHNCTCTLLDVTLDVTL